ncbi:hypothetical protein N5C81_15045 [Rhizobium pusense]|uniref:hypothetical protein n=1 Tax=Agrobacterium pusense TaxID=648995 RepID=UPI00244C0DD1|nr:hypothetical protein [Agrobacterium pusense]MDH1268940.1 hypothetical protein [Agrobacterium pusense]
MPSNLKRQELLTKIRTAVADEFRANGSVLEKDMTDRICEAEKKTITSLGLELARRAVSSMVVGQINSWVTLSLAGEAQMSLPGIPEDIASELPPTITVKVAGKGTRYVAISHATIGELRQYEAMLAEQIENDRRKHRAIRYVVTKCAGEDDDMLVSEYFKTETVVF